MKLSHFRFAMTLSLALLIGCGGGSQTNQPNGGNTTTTPPPPVTGFADSWHFNVSSGLQTLDAALTFSGNSIAGVAHFQSYNASASSPCPTFFDNLPLTGTIDGQGHASLKSSPVGGAVLSLDGLLASDHASLSNGSYHFTGGCDAAESGTLTGAKSGLIYGGYTGTMQLSGNTINVSAMLTQASQSDSHGFFSVAGTISVQNSCNLTYTLSGASVVGAVAHLYGTTSYNLNPLDGLTGKVNSAADQIELDDYPYSDDCTAGAHGVVTRQLR